MISKEKPPKYQPWNYYFGSQGYHPWDREFKHKSPSSPYFKTIQEVEEKRISKELTWYWKEDKPIPSTYYNYDRKTKFLTNKELKDKYLTKVTLTDVELKELTTFMEKRRHLLDAYSTYHFSRVYYELIERLEFEDFNTAEPELSKQWLIWIMKLKKWKNEGYGNWENFKERMGYWSQKEMVQVSDYAAVRRDMIEHNWHEKYQTNSQDRIWGNKAERILPRDPEFLEGKVDQVELRRFILMMQRKVRNKEMLRKEAVWQYHNPWRRRRRYIPLIEEFLYEKHRHVYLHFNKLQYDLPFILEEVKKLKKWKTHERRVDSSWRFLLDKKIPLRSKVQKFLDGDLWLQSKISFHEFFGFSWGSEYEKHKKGQSQVYSEVEWAARLSMGEWSPNSSNPWIQKFHKLNYLDQWHWGVPYWFGNHYYIKQYFEPWLKNVKKQNSTDLFWFKFSHRELTYLKRADGSRVRKDTMFSGAMIRKYQRILTRIWYEKKSSLDKKSPKHNLFFEVYPKALKKKLIIPLEFLPDKIWIKYYTYDGPNFWWQFKHARGTDPLYYGPFNLPSGAIYKTMYHEYLNREFFYFLYNLWLPGTSTKYLFYLNPKFFIFICIISFFLFLIYFFFSVKPPLKGVSWKLLYQTPIYVTAIFRETGKPITQIAGFKKHILAGKRHHFNWWVVWHIVPIIVFSIFLPIWFIKLRFYWYYKLTNWIIFLGVASFIYILKLLFVYGLNLFFKWLEETVTAEDYQKVLEHERQLTWAAEKRYLGLKARKQKEKGVKYNPDHLDF